MYLWATTTALPKHHHNRIIITITKAAQQFGAVYLPASMRGTASALSWIGWGQNPFLMTFGSDEKGEKVPFILHGKGRAPMPR
jgi:hypothetical protein